jgi:hypothetical protein
MAIKVCFMITSWLLEAYARLPTVSTPPSRLASYRKTPQTASDCALDVCSDTRRLFPAVPKFRH